MSVTSLTTADQLFEMPHKGNRYELVEGVLRMMSPSGWKHGEIVGILHTLLGSHIRQQRLGKIFGAETGFKIAKAPDTVRAPDIAFIANSNLPSQEPSEGFWPGVPDLAVEVLSPSDRTGEVTEKLHTWLDAGVIQVWAVDPRLKTVTIYRSATDAVLITANQRLEANNLLPGFSCAMNEIFED